MKCFISNLHRKERKLFLFYCCAGTTETRWKRCRGKSGRRLGSGSQRVNMKANRTPASYPWKPKPLASFLSRPTHCYFKHLLKRNVAKLISVKFLSIWIKPLPFVWAIPGLSGSASHGFVRHLERDYRVRITGPTPVRKTWRGLRMCPCNSSRVLLLRVTLGKLG